MNEPIKEQIKVTTDHSSDIRNTRIFQRCSKTSIFKYFKIWKCEYVKIREYNEKNAIPALIVVWLFFFHPTNHLFLKLNVVHFMCWLLLQQASQSTMSICSQPCLSYCISCKENAMNHTQNSWHQHTGSPQWHLEQGLDKAPKYLL